MPGTSSVSMASTSSWLSSRRYGTSERCVMPRFQTQPSGARRTPIDAASSATAAASSAAAASASDPDADGAAGSLARENARRNPARIASTASALMIGLALVTFVAMFAKVGGRQAERITDLRDI